MANPDIQTQEGADHVLTDLLTNSSASVRKLFLEALAESGDATVRLGKLFILAMDVTGMATGDSGQVGEVYQAFGVLTASTGA